MLRLRLRLFVSFSFRREMARRGADSSTSAFGWGGRLRLQCLIFGRVDFGR